MARALNKVMRRKGQVFADRYYARLLETPKQAALAVHYVLRNRDVHQARAGREVPQRPDPCASDSWREHWPPLVVAARWWMLCVGVTLYTERTASAA